MKTVNNYKIQMEQAQAHFLAYDQQALIRKIGNPFDEQYLYYTMLNSRYRLNRTTASLERWVGETWVDANTFAEVMTLLDMVCDSKETRCPAGRWKSMADFGLTFHRSMLEEADPWALKCQEQLPQFRRACLALGGRELPNGDAAYALPLFDGLELALQLWLGDDEFPPNLRWLWDENAPQYIRYETMHFARGLVLERMNEEMEKSGSGAAAAPGNRL